MASFALMRAVRIRGGVSSLEVDLMGPILELDENLDRREPAPGLASSLVTSAIPSGRTARPRHVEPVAQIDSARPAHLDHLGPLSGPEGMGRLATIRKAH